MINPKSIHSLQIYRDKVLAGTLTRTKLGCEFIFDNLFLQTAKYSELSFTMPKSQNSYKLDGSNLHPFFAGLLPEGLRLKSILKNLKTSADDLFTLFAAVSRNVVGDVYAIHDDLAENPVPAPKLKEIDFYSYFEQLTAMNSYAHGEDAIAGVQEKFSAAMMSFPINIAKADKSYILKLNPPDKPHLVQNEFQSMTLAQKCKIQTANFKIVRDKNKNPGLLVERFDRRQTPAGRLLLHQEDACQFLGLYPSEKYRVSFKDIALGLKPLVSSENASLLKLIKLYCFSYLLGNGDLHAKNISLLVQENGLVDLSPAYDLLCTYIYADQHMALKLDGRDTNFKAAHIQHFAQRMGLKPILINTMLKNLVGDFSKNYLLLKQIEMPKKQWIHLEKTILTRLKGFA